MFRFYLTVLDSYVDIIFGFITFFFGFRLSITSSRYRLVARLLRIALNFIFWYCRVNLQANVLGCSWTC